MGDTTRQPTKTNGGTDAAAPPNNVVYLRGKLADAPIRRELPSGDVLLSFRLTVSRPPGDRSRVDSLECVAVRARPRGVVERAEAGDELEVEGSLQRRFWRSPSGPASRYAVAVDVARRVRQPVRAATITARLRGDA